MYRRDPIISSSPPPEATRSRSHSPGDKAGTYVTQPTQPLGARSPYFAVPGSPTQPTQILTPRANRMYSVSSQLQVLRSSPPADRTSPPFETQSYSQAHPQPAFKPMRPPGTGFAPPTAVRKPIFDLTSDDPPVEPDPFASESEYKSNIHVSKGDLSSKTSRVAETPEKPSWNLSSYAYNGSANQRKRSFSGTDDSSPKKMRVHQRQGGPSRAIPIDLTSEDGYTSVDQILDPDLRKKTERMRAIFPSEPIQKLYDALIKKKGHFDDAMAYVTEQEFETIPSSPNFGVAKHIAKPAKKATTQRTLNKPVESILDKYSRLKSTQSQQPPISPTSPEIEQPKRKRKLIRGRKNPLPSSPEASPAKPPPQAQKRTQVVSDDEDEGIVNISDDESVRELTPEVVSPDDSLLDFFNSCSVEAMVDLSGHKEEDVRETLEKRPFTSLEAVKKIHVDSQQSQDTDKKKKARKPRITFGARLVESAEDMWDAYSLMDSVVTQCEELGKPMVAGMARWGIDIFGGSTEEGVDVTSLDDSSDSSRDSGYHTPRSDAGDSNVRKATKKTKLLKQPAIMNDGVELKDYQVVGLNWLNLLWQNKISGILADDMGLGKTCQVIAFLSHLKMQNTGKPALIIVPGSTLENWLREFQRFSGTINFTPYYGPQAERYEYQNTILHNISQGECDVIITTYDLTFRKDDNGFLRRCRPQICIFDEGHVLKNATTIRYRSLLRIKTDIRILLTGTPLQNSLQELMSILGFLMPDVFYKDHDENGVKVENRVPEMLQTLFKHKAKVTETESHSTLLSAQRIQRARTMLTPFILRRKKAQVLKHLPKKTSRVEYCDLTETQEVLYKQQLDKQRKILQDRAAGIYVKDHANVMMKLRQAAIHPLLFRHRYTDDKIRKMSKACLKEETFMESNPDIIFEELQIYQDYQCHQLATKYPRALSKFELKNNEWMDSGKVAKLILLLQKYKANGDRALVFSQFTSVMDILGWVFDTSDIPYMRMDGSTPIKERQSLMDDFYADESIGVFMISTKSGGAGINLACANKVVIFDSSFNPQDDIQAENRAHRVGQTREVEVVRLVTRGTVEEQIYALGVSKLELDKLVQGEEGDDGSEKKGKKKADRVGAADALSKAEEAGMQAVEKMLMEEIEGKDEGGKKDVKEQFMDGLKKAGVNVAE